MDAHPTAERLEALLSETAWVRALAARLTADAAEAEDLVQESWLAALRRPPSLDTPLRPWLATVVRNAARYAGRGRANRAARESGAAPAEASVPSPDEEVELLESQELLTRKVRELPDELRRVVLLRFFEGLNSKQIGARLGVPDGTVRWRLAKALERLREGLDDSFDGDRRAWMAALLPLARMESGALGVGALGTLLAAGIAMPWTLKLALAAGFALALSMLLSPSPEPVGPVAQATRVAQQGDAREPLPPAADTPLAAPSGTTEREEARGAAAARADVDAAQEGPPRTRVSLRVVDALGRPVAGARVEGSPAGDTASASARLAEELSPLELARELAGHRARSGADGTAVLETRLLRESGSVRIEVLGPSMGYWSETFPVDPGELLELGDAVLQPAGAVAGRVLDGRGAGLRAFLRLVPEELEPDASTDLAEASPPVADAVLSGSADEEGEFRIDGVPAGSYRLWARPIDREGWVRSRLERVQVGLLTSLELTCDSERLPERTVVRVVTPDGEPRPRARLLIEWDGGRRMDTVVDENGETAPGSWLDAGRGFRLLGRDPQHEFAPGEVRLARLRGLVEVRLEPTATTLRRLRVLGPDGAAVDAFSAGVAALGATTWITAESPGEAGLELRLPSAPGEGFDLSINSEGCIPVELEGLVAASLPEPWVVRLEEPVGISGRVTLDGEPVRRPRLRISHRTDPGQLVRSKGHVGGVRWFAGHDARGARDGSFEVPLEFAGDWVLRVEARGGACALVDLEGYDPAVGRRDLAIELAHPARLEGSVLDGAGRPMPRAVVVAAHPLHEGRSTRADGRGRYAFEGVPPGEWNVFLAESGDPGSGWTEFPVDPEFEFPSNVTLLAGQTRRFDLHVLPEALRTVRGRLRPAPGSSPSASVVAWRDNERDPFATYGGPSSALRPDGSFELVLPGPGAWDLVLQDEGIAGSPRIAFEHTGSALEFDADFAWATLAGQIEGSFPPGAQHWIRLSWTHAPWTLEGASVELGEDLAFGPLAVAAGDVVLVHVLSVDGVRTETRQDLWLEAGEQRDVRVP